MCSSKSGISAPKMTKRMRPYSTLCAGNDCTTALVCSLGPRSLHQHMLRSPTQRHTHTADDENWPIITLGDCFTLLSSTACFRSGFSNPKSPILEPSDSDTSLFFIVCSRFVSLCAGVSFARIPFAGALGLASLG
jgi:hypothetical protein